MKKIFTIFAGLSILAWTVSCQQFNVDTQMTDEEYAQHIELVCSAVEQYDLPAANPQSITFNVSSNASWIISGATEWLTVTPASSSAAGLISDVTITAAPNETTENRSATLTISNDKYDTQPYTVVINQSRKGELFVQPVPQNFEGIGGTLAFTIESNYPWKVRTSETWLTVDKTSGEASDQVITVNATATENEGVERRAIVTVTAGYEEKTFEVIQNGIAFNIVVPESTEINSKGGELVVEMNTPLAWTIKGDNDAFTVEKVDATHFKVSAPFNNKFAERKVTVTAESKIGKEDLVITQDTNFELQNCEVLEDGSVKLSGDQKSRIYLKGEHRYIEAKFTFGEKHFESKGEAWFSGSIGDCNIYNQLTLGGNMRFRTDGTALNSQSTYANTSFSVTQDDLNSMNSYFIRIAQSASDETKLNLVFKYNDSALVDDNSHLNAFAFDNSMVDDYFFGFYNSSTNGTWYIVTTGEFTDIAE